jgi:hypothetical protein
VVAVTEREWWSATAPEGALDWLFFDGRAADRKLRLFSVACCRRIAASVAGTPFVRLMDVTEAFADGLASEAEVSWHLRQARASQPDCPRDDATLAILDAAGSLDADRWRLHRSRGWYEDEDNQPYPLWIVGEVQSAQEDRANDYTDRVRDEEALVQVRLLHDIFGPLPFRDIPVSPSWLTADVRLLAQGIYDAKAFGRMPILADALQDAGCDNDEILSHCRAADWEHVRGCWVIDLLLGRPWREPGTQTGG